MRATLADLQVAAAESATRINEIENQALARNWEMRDSWEYEIRESIFALDFFNKF